MKGTPLNIALLTCDWRDDYQNSFSDFKDKLSRDRLGPFYNRFFVIAWTHQQLYVKKGDKFSSVHIALPKFMIKPISDMLAIIAFPYSLWRLKCRPDVIVVYDFGLLPSAWASKLLWGGKIAMYVNNMPRMCSLVRHWGSIKWAYSYLTEKLFLSVVDRFFTINETMKRYLVDLGVSEKSISVFSVNTIQRDMQYIKLHQTGVIRSRLGLGLDKKIILTVGRLEEEKNHKKLLELFSCLGDEFVLCLVGRGSLQSELENYSFRLGISDRVFFEGLVSRRNIWDYYADADVFVLLSKAEALGVVFWEAMYMGVPVIGSNAGGISESLGAAGERGKIWLDSDGHQGFKKMINFCVQDSLEKREMIDRSRHFVEQMISNSTEINDFF